jgi:fatty-acyl-CoA synthase
VSTNEVGEVLAMFPGIELANVYGVEVPHCDGKAGMAAIQTRGEIDYAALLAHLRRELPAYAVPLFLRLQPEAEVTGTFKFKKVELVRDGFDPAKGGEPVLWLDAAAGTYVPLDAAGLERIAAGTVKF